MRHEISRGDASINNTHLPKNIISKLYPTIPQPPSPNPLNISAYEGIYTHPAYPDLRISSSCPNQESTTQGLECRIPDLCASIVNPNEYSKYLPIDLFHVSGTFWVQIAKRWGVLDATRLEFRIDPNGVVSWLGIEIETVMRVHEQKIWWKRMNIHDRC